MSFHTTPELNELPSSLTDRDQWVCWRERTRDGKVTKVPIDPTTLAFASTADSATWTSFAVARERLDHDDVDGLGFVFTEDDDIVGIDLDDCRNQEASQPDARAEQIIDTLDSYTEVSPSNAGYHILLRGTLPTGRNRCGSVEMYDTGRFFTVTGDHLDATPATLCKRDPELEQIHEQFIATASATTEADSDLSATSNPTVSDEQLLERAQSAVNGAKFGALWSGDSSGYDSHSEADMALCCHLAFWTSGDARQMDRLFRRSGLMRPKWDEVHYSDGSTYGEKTIKRAIQQTTEYYDPDSLTEVTQRYRSDSRQAPRAEFDPDRIQARVSATETTLEHLETAVSDLEASIDDVQQELAQEREARQHLEEQVIALKDRSLLRSLWKTVTSPISTT